MNTGTKWMTGASKKQFEEKEKDVDSQYDVKQHKVFDPKIRPDKLIKQYRGEGAIYETVLQSVARIGIPYQ